MSKPFTPRKKKPVKPTEALKSVRIDRNTKIMVSVNLSDEDARARFYARHKQGQFSPEDNRRMYPMRTQECYKEIPVGSVEHLSQILDETNIPEIE